jgi:hypothetical protein
MTAKVTITKRIDPCNCGCQGQDPQHKQSYKRVLHEERVETGSCKVKAYGYSSGPAKYDRVATASAPWAEGERVKVVRLVLEHPDGGGKTAVLGWYYAQ